MRSGIHCFNSTYNYLWTKIPSDAVKNKVQEYSINSTLKNQRVINTSSSKNFYFDRQLSSYQDQSKLYVTYVSEPCQSCCSEKVLLVISSDQYTLSYFVTRQLTEILLRRN